LGALHDLDPEAEITQDKKGETPKLGGGVDGNYCDDKNIFYSMTALETLIKKVKGDDINSHHAPAGLNFSPPSSSSSSMMAMTPEQNMLQQIMSMLQSNQQAAAPAPAQPMTGVTVFPNQNHPSCVEAAHATGQAQSVQSALVPAQQSVVVGMTNLRGDTQFEEDPALPKQFGFCKGQNKHPKAEAPTNSKQPKQLRLSVARENPTGAGLKRHQTQVAQANLDPELSGLGEEEEEAPPAPSPAKRHKVTRHEDHETLLDACLQEKKKHKNKCASCGGDH
jgi:hypothetical protein